MGTSNLHTALLCCLFILGAATATAQEFSLGLKGGLNYSVNRAEAQIDLVGERFNTDSRIGYQAGIFMQLEFDYGLFFRPDVYYNHVEGEFPLTDLPSLYTINKVSFPLLAGYHFYRGFSAFAGPAYQHFLNTELENISGEVENQQKNYAGQIGLMYEFRRFQIDLRYDFTLSSKGNRSIEIGGNRAHFDDGRLNQYLLSLNYKLFDSSIERDDRRKRKGNCYF